MLTAREGRMLRSTPRFTGDSIMAKTILCADDSVTVQKVAEITFAGSEYRYVGAKSADDALRLAKSESTWHRRLYWYSRYKPTFLINSNQRLNSRIFHRQLC